MKKKSMYDDSDEFDVDEPDEFEESGSDWDPEKDEPGNKRKSRSKVPQKKIRNIKKKKVEKEPATDEDNHGEESDGDSTPTVQKIPNGTTTPNVSMKAFTNGSFVVLKTDFETKDNPPLWKIDGKALLQKYIPIEQEGKTLYKNTSTYSGWTPSNQDLYSPAPVTYMQQNKKEIIIQFNREKVKLEDTGEGTTETADAKV